MSDDNWIYKILTTLFGTETIYGRCINNKNNHYESKEDNKIHNSIVNAKKSIDTLEKKKNHLEKKLKNITNDIKILQTEGNKKNALSHAQRAVKIKKQIEDIQKKIIVVENTIVSVESAQQNKETVNIINDLNETIKGILNEENIKNIENIIEDNYNMEESSNEISEILNQSSSNNAQLLQLEAEDFLNDIDYTTKIENFDVNIINTSHINNNKEKDDDEIMLEILTNDMEIAQEIKDDTNINIVESAV